MSFDLAIWEGTPPSFNDDALPEFQRLYDVYMDPEPGDDATPDNAPTPAIRAYVEALLSRWPDITEDAGEDSPWADGPLIDNASGPLLYIGIGWSRADEVCDVASDLAAAHGLVCFDPQACRLLTPKVPDRPSQPSGATTPRRWWKRR